jgi:hypothetical protein
MSDHDEIAKRAYELYLERGSVPGYELEDWLTAEAEVTAAAAEAEEQLEASEPVGGKRATPVAGGKRGAGRRENPTSSRRSLRP